MDNNVFKNTYWRYLELFNGMQIIRDALDFVGQRKNHYFIPLSGQLRALFVLPHDQNNQLKKITDENKPVSFELAEELGVELNVYVRKQEYDEKENQYFSHLFDTTTYPTKDNIQKVSLKDWMELDVIVINGVKIKIWQVIKKMADKNGGAHYDRKLPLNDFELYNARNKANISVLFLVLAKIGEVLFNVGFKIIELGFNFHFILALGLKITSNLSEKKNIVTYGSSRLYYAPVSISIDEKKLLNLKLSAPDGRFYEFDIGPQKTNEITVISFSYQLTEKMHVMLSVYYGYDLIFKYELHSPLYIGISFPLFDKIIFSDKDIEVGYFDTQLYYNILSENMYKIKYLKLRRWEEEDIVVLTGPNTLIRTDKGADFDGCKRIERFYDFIKS